jgi:hypothetical protein
LEDFHDLNDVENEPFDLATSMEWAPRRTILRDGPAQPPSFKKRNQRSLTKGLGLLTPAQYFRLFFDDHVLETFVMQTNACAERKSVARWKTLTVAEFLKFIGVLILIGLKRVPVIRSLWEKGIYYCAVVNETISRNRFEAILSCLQWIDPAFSKAELAEKNRVDPFWSVDTLVAYLASKSSSLYDLCQSCDGDEQAIPTKGRHRCRCYNCNKPAKFHFKMYCLNCSATGYMYNFFLYKGKDERRPEGQTATMYPILRLTEDPALHHLGHVVYGDNWYTSLPLIRALRDRGIQYVGTVKSRVKGLPKQSLYLKGKKRTAAATAATAAGQVPMAKKLRGDMDQLETTSLGDTIYFTAWQDTKPVHLLATFNCGRDTVVRKVINKKRRAGEPCTMELKKVTRPAIIGAYNRGMGGTDMIDQKIAYYRIRLRCRRWKTKIYAHMINAMLCNAHILYKQDFTLERSHPHFTLKDFMESVMYDLISSDSSVEPDRAISTHGTGRHLSTCLSDVSRLTGLHFPVQLPNRSRDSVTGKQVDKRLNCRICTKKCLTKCEQCNIPLHIGCDGVTESCWKTFHTLM